MGGGGWLVGWGSSYASYTGANNYALVKSTLLVGGYLMAACVFRF